METGLDAVGDHACAVAPRRWRRRFGQAERKQQAHAIRSSQVQILANHRLEEMPALHRPGKHLREADLHLLQREPMGVAGGPINRGDRGREPRRPPIEEGLHVGRSELVTDRLELRRIGAREKPIVETVEGDGRAPQLLLHPFMPIETELDGIRHIGAELQERRAPVGILDVEVVVIDGHRLPREVKRDAALGA